jgi:translation initiation factor 2 beta subunit (eIF-2beta)/eIF-5
MGPFASFLIRSLCLAQIEAALRRAIQANQSSRPERLRKHMVRRLSSLLTRQIQLETMTPRTMSSESAGKEGGRFEISQAKAALEGAGATVTVK